MPDLSDVFRQLMGLQNPTQAPQPNPGASASNYINENYGPAVEHLSNLLSGGFAEALGRWATQPQQTFKENVLGQYQDPNQMLMGVASPRSLTQGESPTYFSNVLSAFENPKVPAKLTRDQALSVLKSPGVKLEENKWLGMEDFLKGKEKWSKDEITQYVRDHQIDVQHLQSDAPQYAQYTLPGGSNYQEHLLTWGNKPTTPDPISNAIMSDLGFPETPGLPIHDDFTSGHFDEPNILAHFRTTDRLTPEGKKVLMVEEIQSDWQKALRKQDVAQQDPTQTWDYKASKILHDKGLGEYAPLGTNELENPNITRNLARPHIAPPEAPLARDYLNLASKRITRMAAEEGYDAVGFTTGKQQAQRYNQALLDSVDRVDYNPYSQDLDVWKGGKKIHTMQVPVTKLAETVGQENAEKLLQNMNRNIVLRDNKTNEVLMKDLPSREAAWDAVQEGKVKSSGYGVKIEGFEPTSSISGKDLKVGERGYSQVYDEQIPRAMDKLGKQFGARTQEGRVSTAKALGTQMYEDVHLFPLTPTLREAAKSKGFPLFELGAGALGAAGLASQRQKDKDATYTLH